MDFSEVYRKLEKGEIPFNVNELSKLLDHLELNPLEAFEFTEKQQIFINSSNSGNISGNICSTINNNDINMIRKLIQEELKTTV